MVHKSPMYIMQCSALHVVTRAIYSFDKFTGSYSLCRWNSFQEHWRFALFVMLAGFRGGDSGGGHCYAAKQASLRLTLVSDGNNTQQYGERCCLFCPQSHQLVGLEKDRENISISALQVVRGDEKWTWCSRRSSSWEISARNLALQVGEVSNEKIVLYDYWPCTTRRSEWLHSNLQTCPLVREGALHASAMQFKIWSWAPKANPTPSDWLTVDRKINFELRSVCVCVCVCSGIDEFSSCWTELRLKQLSGMDNWSRRTCPKCLQWS
jgi:hypothetical protein